MKFKIGDEVVWSSQSGGRWKEKVGKVIARVDKGRDVHSVAKRFYGKHAIGPISLSCATRVKRDHVSYLVLVGNKLYWPRVSKLWLT